MDATELHELLEVYRDVLDHHLRTPARPSIHACTDVARDNKIAAKHLVHVIEQHLKTRADPRLKLPALYLIDSIVKNVGEPYITEFSKNLPAVVYNVWKAGGQMVPPVEKVLRTWDGVFSPETLASVQATIHPAMVSSLQAVQPRPAAAAHGDPRRRAVPAAVARSVSGPLKEEQAWMNGASISGQHAVAMPSSVQSHLYPPAAVPYGFAPAMHAPMHPVHAPRAPYQAGLGAQPPAAHSARHSDQLLSDYRRSQQTSQLVATTSAAQVQAANQTRLGRVNIKEFSPIVLNALKHKSSKTRRFILDNSMQRRRRKSSNTMSSRQWFAPADMWVAGTAQDAIDDDPELHEADAHVAVVPTTPTRFTVKKDDMQSTCAVSSEPFREEWDDVTQEWVYVDAVRLTAAAAKALDVHAGAIVKVALLDQDVLDMLSAAPDTAAPSALAPASSGAVVSRGKRPLDVALDSPLPKRIRS